MASRAQDDDHTIRIVSSLPLTGSSRVQSETMVLGIKMALEEAGYKAGPFTITYDSWDDASAQAGTWDPAKEKDNASRAVSDPDVMAYIGTYNSGAAKIAIPILNQADLVMVSPANTYSGLTKVGFGEKGEPEIYYPKGIRTYCRVVPADDLQGLAGAWWANQLGVKKAYILNDKELYGRGLARVFEEGCRRLGIEVVGEEGIDYKAQDFRAVVNKVRASQAEIVYFGGITQNGAGKLVKDLRSGGYTGYFMSPDGTKEEAFIKSAGPASEGCLVTLGGLPPEQMGPEAQAWYKAYRKKYRSEPEAYAIYSYEATKVTLAGIAKAGVKDRTKIREAIMATADYDGLLGKWSFDKQGDTTLSSMSGYVVKDGDFAFSKALQAQFEDSGARSSGSAGEPGSHVDLSLTSLLQQILNGLSKGALIGVIALGYTLVYGIVELINFAHGDVFMMGAMASLTGVLWLGLGGEGHGGLAAVLGMVLVLLCAMIFAGLLNRTIDRVAYRRLRNSPRLVPLITAIGMSFILMNLGGYWKGWAPVNFPSLLGEHDINLLGKSSSVSFTVSQFLVILVTVPLLGGLYRFINHTRQGKAMRATAQNPDAARLMGIDVDRTISLAFLLGGALAGAAGFLYGFYNQEVRFDLGFRLGLDAFTAAVLGGIGNVQGAVLGGVIIGMVEAFTAFYLSQALSPAMVFAVLIVVIMIRPSGILGDTGTEKV
jgi:branched-chain amino acid transport system substrate-binding protein